MTDVTVATGSAPALRKVRQPKTNLPSIKIGDDTWNPRKQSAGNIGVCETTIKRMNPETTYVGGVAYVCHEKILQKIASQARARNEAPELIRAEHQPVRRRRLGRR
jgi:hypothetical protein